MTARRFRLLLAVAGIVAFGVRVAWVVKVSRDPVGLFDPARYLGYAREIADGHGMVEPFSGHPTAYYPPGYPWFLGLVAWLSAPVTDDTVLAAGLVQAAMGAATAVLGGLVARRLAGRVAGLVAATGLALYPNLVFHSGALLGETLYDLLFVSFLVAMTARPWNHAFTTARSLACGAVLGLAIMVRPISLAVIPVVVICWWLASRDRRQVVRWSIALLVGTAVCIVPWTVRNAIRMDTFVAISTNTGDNLCIGHAPGADGSFRLTEACATEFNVLDGPAAEVAADRAKTRLALHAIADDPGREPWLAWRRFWFTWVRDGDHDGLLAVQSYRADRFLESSTEARLARVADISYWVVCGAGVLGAATIARRRSPQGLLVVGSAVITAAVPLAFFGDSRFKVPVMPLLIVIAATLAGRNGRGRAAEPSGAVPVDGLAVDDGSITTGPVAAGRPDV